MTALIAIVGRPNVGKSTLFNRLCGVRVALVDPTPGVTRDRRFGDAKLGNLNFEVIDTAGLEEATKDSIEAGMQHQTDLALEQADGVLLMIDARAGITPLDRHFAEKLRRAKVPVILVANKCEGKAGMPGLAESYGLGLGEPLAFSAEHGEGLSELYDALLPYAGERDNSGFEESDDYADDDGDDSTRPISLAIVGRPNVGKSTLVNKLLGEERMLTGPEAGITRDSITTKWDFQGREIRLVDTAGLRKKARVTEKVESLSTGDSIRSIKFAQVVVLVLDSADMMEKQDLTIARRVVEEGRVLVIAVNKWDLVKDSKKTLAKLTDRLQTSLPQARGIPIITMSAKTGRGIDRLLPAVLNIYELWNKRISTGALNRWLDGILDHHPPPLSSGKRIRLRYMTQAKTRPPTFVVFASRPTGLPESYNRYLVNALREDFDLPGIPIRLHTKKGKNPYAD